jgi:DNA-binding SARP family transcriptional activator
MEAREACPRLTVQNRFSLRLLDESPVRVAGEAQRLLAFLALSGPTLPRDLVAGTLWPHVSEGHARSSLRSVLARMPRSARDLVEVDHVDVGLSCHIAVDIWASRALAHGLLEHDSSTSDHGYGPESVGMMSTDLLPGWYDEWVLFEAESWRQLRMHALEELAHRLARAGRYGEAATAALAAIRADPLRESAHAALIRLHVAEGNRSEALRQFNGYCAILAAGLGLEPTAGLRGLVDFSQPAPAL